MSLLTPDPGRGTAETSGEAHPTCASPTRWFASWSGRGLRVGDSLGKLKRLYPRAIHGPGGWAIVYSLQSVIAEGSRLDIVTAQVRHDRVSALRLWIGGAGD